MVKLRSSGSPNDPAHGTVRESARSVRSTALRLLAIRPRTRRELASRLGRRGFEAPAIEQVLNDLEGSGLLDDRSAALTWANARARRFGPAAVTAFLRQRGVERQLAEEVVRGVFRDLDEERLARAALERGLGRRGSADPTRARQRVWAALRRRGYSSEVIRRVLDVEPQASNIVEPQASNIKDTLDSNTKDTEDFEP